ncbi:hypothetical protein ID866_9171 [Astraeus odoratus]|nr:hypothetical protein ID866_9171 [Astraeus odoratus]
MDYDDGMIHLHAITYRDAIALGDFIINPQEIGIPIELNGFPATLDGILGPGPSRSIVGHTEDGNLVHTVVDNLHSQGSISYPVLGVYFWPANVESARGAGGILSFGSIDDSALTSDMGFVPVTQTPPASNFWGVDASAEYDKMQILGPTSGILDTGSYGIYVPGDTFVAYRSATGAAIDVFDANNRLTISQALYDNLQTLSILIGSQSYKLSPNAQIYPRTSPDAHIFLVVACLSSDSSLGFKLGSAFFQRYYVAFNSSSSQVGFASHLHTQSTTN